MSSQPTNDFAEQHLAAELRALEASWAEYAAEIRDRDERARRREVLDAVRWFWREFAKIELEVEAKIARG